MHQSANGPSYAIRDGDWKLIMKSSIKNKSGKLGVLTPKYLFNLKENLTEDSSRNLVSDPNYAKKIALMKAKYIELRETGESTVSN
jgi:hypothetical protein